jgi:hypothetical protein
VNFPEPYVIIGSGASAAAVAAVLISKGIKPLILDPGGKPDAIAIAASKSLSNPGQAAATVVGKEKSNPGEKTWFGSNYVFSQNEAKLLSYGKNVIARGSYSEGGLTRVWGGTFSFFKNIENWPIGTEPSSEDFHLIETLVPHSQTTFENFQGNKGLVRGSDLTGQIFSKVKNTLKPNWWASPSVVAIDSRFTSPLKCENLNLCLSGCPKDSIWFAGNQFASWEAKAQVRRKSFTVRSIATKSSQGMLHISGDNAGVEQQTIIAEKVFLAAGAFETAAILLRSNFVESVEIQDVATAFAAAISLKGTSLKTSINHHGLSQWWAGTANGEFSAQMYPADLRNVNRLNERFPWLKNIPYVANFLAARLHPVIAYLEGAKSTPINMKIHQDQIEVNAFMKYQNWKTFKKYFRQLGRIFMKVGLILPGLSAEFSLPGTGYHFGSSFPHGKLTDSLGRLEQSKNLFIVDSSVLPSLEVGSITPTVMANAARIARESLQGKA